MKPLIGYKIVANSVNGELRSYTAMPPIGIIYKPGEKTYPVVPLSPLFLFDTLVDAIEFSNYPYSNPAYSIWRCEYEKFTGRVRSRLQPPYITSITSVDFVQQFWEIGYWKFGKLWRSNPFPGIDPILHTVVNKESRNFDMRYNVDTLIGGMRYAKWIKLLNKEERW